MNRGDWCVLVDAKGVPIPGVVGRVLGVLEDPRRYQIEWEDQDDTVRSTNPADTVAYSRGNDGTRCPTW